MKSGLRDIVTPANAKTLAGLFRQRVDRTPDLIAYRYYDYQCHAWNDMTWREVAVEVGRWQAALARESLHAGDRVAVMLHNCCQWIMYDLAALGRGLVVVPLYVNDRADNIAYILRETAAKILLIAGQEHWQLIRPVVAELGELQRIVALEPITGTEDIERLTTVDRWLPGHGTLLQQDGINPDTLATIVFTSGTTGRPKGVMLSHQNILWNAFSSQKCIDVYCGDLFLSFLPLSHTLERTIGYYLPIMTGATVAYARSIPQLAEDLHTLRPTVFISVPRIYERVFGRLQEQLETKSLVARRLFELAVNTGWKRFEYRQGRSSWSLSLLLWPMLKVLVANKVMSRLGGRIRIAITGGAPLPPTVAKVFIGLGMPLLQGYGLTETSPVISVNRPDNNRPAGVGLPLEDVEIRVNDDGELLVKSPGVMLGYWNNPQATAEVIDPQAWLHTGDKVRVENGHIYITGRVKEIIVMSNGEKIPPADMEMAIATDTLIEHVMIVGEARPFLAALIVLNPQQWEKLSQRLGLRADDPAALESSSLQRVVLERIARQLHDFPGYAQVRAVSISVDPWEVGNGLHTPTLKLRRNRIMEYFCKEIEQMYAGH
jgi:long-chain acyl-CoA synthetase